VLAADNQPTPDSIEQFVDHLDTFWETIQLCLVMDCLGELESTSTNVKKLFETCHSELFELVNSFPASFGD